MCVWRFSGGQHFHLRYSAGIAKVFAVYFSFSYEIFCTHLCKYLERLEPEPAEISEEKSDLKISGALAQCPVLPKVNFASGQVLYSKENLSILTILQVPNMAHATS